jgi:hypothetical protein
MDQVDQIAMAAAARESADQRKAAGIFDTVGNRRPVPLPLRARSIERTDSTMSPFKHKSKRSNR